MRHSSFKTLLAAAACATMMAASPALAFDRDNNPPGPRGGPGTNWENPPGPRGGPGASPDVSRRFAAGWCVTHPRKCRTRVWRRFDNDNNPPGPRGGPGTNWENPPGPRGGPGTSPNRRRWR